MNIDEAIKHAREVAERNRRAINFEPGDSVDDDIKTNCLNCAEEHEQLAEWLEELKRYRELEAKLNGITVEQIVNAFVERIEKETNEGYERGMILTNADADMWEAYKALGTPEECRKAVKRQKPNSRPCLTDEDSVTCGNCGSDVDVTFYEYTYCPHCGQRVR